MMYDLLPFASNEAWKISPALQLEIVGSIDAGIVAVSWNPDNSVFSIITGAFIIIICKIEH